MLKFTVFPNHLHHIGKLWLVLSKVFQKLRVSWCRRVGTAIRQESERETGRNLKHFKEHDVCANWHAA